MVINNSSFSWGLKSQEEETEHKDKSKKKSKSKKSLVNKKVGNLNDLSDQTNETKTVSIDSLVVLKEIDLKIKRGEFVCIIGDVGSGKSSILSSMIGDLIPVSKS